MYQKQNYHMHHPSFFCSSTTTLIIVIVHLNLHLYLHGVYTPTNQAALKQIDTLSRYKRPPAPASTIPRCTLQ